MPEHTFFIAVYTNEVKSYCDEKFFTNIHQLSSGNPVHVVDNSDDKTYLQRLMLLCKDFDNFYFYYVEEERHPKASLFHRRITASVLLLREKFLETKLPYFLIIESDVIPPVSLLTKFDNTIKELNKRDKNWGIIGGLYHYVAHLYFLQGLQQTYQALSGCTVYKRSLIESFPFRWSKDKLENFPDTWICWDAKNDYEIYNDHTIRCDHLENPKTGTRYTKPI